MYRTFARLSCILITSAYAPLVPPKNISAVLIPPPIGVGISLVPYVVSTRSIPLLTPTENV